MRVFGILNITPDSFSDGNNFFNRNKAIKHALSLSHKCDVIDIGAQSTRPNAKIVSHSEEIIRLDGIVSEVSQFIQTSIDSFNFETQLYAQNNGVHYINDVSAFQDSKILQKAMPQMHFIFMHHLTIPASKEIIMKTHKMEMITEIKEWAMKKIQWMHAFGIANRQMIFDIGIGFGKNAEQSLFLIEHAEEFLNMGVEIMVGHSRKSFMTLLKKNATLQEKDKITREITQDLQKKSIQNIRVHAP